jgi:hypothetical protein
MTADGTPGLATSIPATNGPGAAESTTLAERPARDPDLVLARVHLRLGALGLARAELETLAGRDLLDDDAIRDLAEARWRTGDTAGAGEAAITYLEVAPDDVLALVIAAEAQADLGRPAEARRLAGRAIGRANGTLDPIFAGIKRSTIWPAEPGSAIGPIGVLFDDLHPGPLGPGARRQRRRSDRRSEPAPGAAAGPGPGPTGGPTAAAPHDEQAGPSLWGDEPGAALSAGGAAVDPSSLFHRAHRALDANRTAEAATGLILALRGSPSLAPAVLDLLSGRAEPILVLIRGDAQRMVGREVEAMRDHAAAARRLVEMVEDPTAPTASDPGHRHGHADSNAAATAGSAAASIGPPASDSSTAGATEHESDDT